MVNDCLAAKVAEDHYYLCLTEDCDVVYYTSCRNKVFHRQDVRFPVWFKNGASPKYICYCNLVTEEQIIDAVVNHQAGDIKDIARLTGAMKNGQCQIKNPTGKCCGPVILKTIRETLGNK